MTTGIAGIARVPGKDGRLMRQAWPDRVERILMPDRKGNNWKVWALRPSLLPFLVERIPPLTGSGKERLQVL